MAIAIAVARTDTSDAFNILGLNIRVWLLNIKFITVETAADRQHIDDLLVWAGREAMLPQK